MAHTSVVYLPLNKTLHRHLWAFSEFLINLSAGSAYVRLAPWWDVAAPDAVNLEGVASWKT